MSKQINIDNLTKRQREKIEQVCELIDEVSLETAETMGGYPDDTDILPDGTIAVAGIADRSSGDEPLLTIYAPEMVLLWHKLITEYRHDYPDAPLWEALGETRGDAEKIQDRP